MSRQPRKRADIQLRRQLILQVDAANHQVWLLKSRLDEATDLLKKLNAKCDELHAALANRKEVVDYQKKLLRILVDVIESPPAGKG